MRFHVIYAVVTLVTFVVLVFSLMFEDYWYYLPEFTWIVSAIFSALALYTGAITATRADADNRGAAIASATIGAVTLFGLMGMMTWGMVIRWW
jgi:Na+/H+-translocating membrane pyrophosphatase